jgi:hypothetical protein
MEVLKIIGLTEADIRKVSVETADSINELEALSSYIDSGEAPNNLKEAYDSLLKEIEKYLYSSEFKSEAKKAGVSISISDVEEEVVVAEIPKVKSKTLSERIAERKKGKSISEIEKVEEPILEEPIIEEPVIEDEDLIVVSELFGVSVKGTKSGEMLGRDRFSMMLSYGNTDYILGFFEDSKGYHYKLELPLSLGQVVFSFSNLGDSGSYKSILDVWRAYAEDNTATLNLISRSENELESLSNVLGFSSVTKERIPLSNSQLKDEKYNYELYENANDIYSRSISLRIYYDIAKYLKAQWTAKKSNSNEWEVYVHGLQYKDYVYKSAESLYNKGGYSIVAKKYTFFVPKGLNKKDVFGEIGTHLKETTIKTSKFEKDIEIGKRFQVSMGKVEDAVDCRVVGSEYKESNGRILIVDEAGDSYKISADAYNYFLKYYGVVSLKVSESTIVVLYNNNIVGIITAEKFNSSEIIGMFDIEDFKSQLRNVDTNAYDFMVSEEDEVEEAVEVEIENIEEGDDDEDALKKELVERIDFLEELLQDAVDDGDNQTLIDELNMELESLNDLLDDIG